MAKAFVRPSKDGTLQNLRVLPGARCGKLRASVQGASSREKTTLIRMGPEGVRKPLAGPAR